MSLRLAFAGTPEFAVPALETLAASTHTLCGVLTQPDRPAGRGRRLTPSAVKLAAQRLGVEVAQPARLGSEPEREPLRRWAPELLVVVAYGLILPTAVLGLPRHGCLNIHASLLPRWRGAAPVQRALLAGDTETGVCIMQLEAGLDTGPVHAREALAIGAHETAGELQQRLAIAGARLLLPVIGAIERGDARPQAQDAAGVCYAGKLTKAEARIDWQQDAAFIERQVRAFNPWPVAETSTPSGRLRLWRAQQLTDVTQPAGAAPGAVLGMRQQSLAVACGRGVLGIEQLQQEGRRAVTAAEYWQAHDLSGQRFT